MGDRLSYNTLHTQTDGGILTVTLDRPPVNALSPEMLQDLADVFEGKGMTDAVRVAIIAATGKVFVAGADIKTFAEHDPDSGPPPTIRLGNDLFNLIEAYPKPVIAAINGACLGGGNELAMACDFRIASRTASFGQPEIKLGLVPGWGGMQRLPRLVGRAHALDLLLTGRTVGAEEALAMGLVHEVVELDVLILRAMELASQLAGMAPLAVRHIKERVARGSSDPQGQAIRDDEWAFEDLLGTQDGQEGLHAFLEKRSPRWRGE